MKLFITNKKELDERFPDDGNSRFKTSKEIHQDSYKELLTSISSLGCIPLCLTPSYKEDGVCLLDFVNKKGDIYFYEFNGTAS